MSFSFQMASRPSTGAEAASYMLMIQFLWATFQSCGSLQMTAVSSVESREVQPSYLAGGFRSLLLPTVSHVLCIALTIPASTALLVY